MLSNSEAAIARRQDLERILGHLPWRVWEEVVREEPEWQNMRPFLEILGFGPFSVLMVVTGLNDFQTKGTADRGYWPPIRELLEKTPNPSSPEDLHGHLLPFYRNERLRTTKVNRLGTFLRSPLAGRLWLSSPQAASEEFVETWESLAETMGQKPEAKTISFAMKCLGMTLIMNGVFNFDSSSIPIPVDSRVGDFTRRVGICTEYGENEIRDVWNEVLHMLRRRDNRITMIHLDSLVWQIEPLGDSDLLEYFNSLDSAGVGNEILAFLCQDDCDGNSHEGIS